MGKVTIKVDYENNAERWWEEARHARMSLAESCRETVFFPLDDGADAVTVPAEDAATFRAWAEKLPGWADGPAYARHPFTFREEWQDWSKPPGVIGAHEELISQRRSRVLG